MDDTAYEGFALVEQMGFRKTVGIVRQVEQYGTKMLRLDVPVPGSDTEFVTRFCGGPSLYQVTPLDKEVAEEMIKRQGDPRPVKPTTFQVEHHPIDEPTNASFDDDDERPF